MIKQPEDIITNFILTKEGFAEYMEISNSLIVFDTETMGLDIEAPVIGLSFYDFSLSPVFVVTDNLFKEGMPMEDLVEICNDYFPSKKAIGHNIKYDLGVTKYNGIVDIPLVNDTSSMIHLHNPDSLKKLEKRVKADLHIEKKTYEEIVREKILSLSKEERKEKDIPKAWRWPATIREWRKNVKDGIITLENMGNYAGEDAYYTGHIYLHYKKLMTDSDNKILQEIEMPLIYTLRDMHHVGIKIDLPVLEKLDVQLDKEINRLQEIIYKKTGSVFNLKSPSQMAEVLYDKLKYPVLGTTSGGARGTGAKILKKLAAKGYDVAQDLVEHSSVKTLSIMFVKAIPKLVASDGRLRCSFNIDVARSGRLSSNAPNLQNIPITNKKFFVRQAFVPSPGCKLIVADLSQIELRIAAHVSGDRNYRKAFLSGQDIHQFVADTLAAASGMEIERHTGKTLNFGIVYGLGAYALADVLYISVSKAKKLIETYKDTYSGYYEWKERNEKFIRKNLFAENIFGRRRQLPQAKDPELWWDAYLKGNNHVIQSSAAEMLKIAMNNIHKDYIKKKMKSALLLTVHDELIVDSPYNEIEEAQYILVSRMENSVKLDIPVIAESKVCTTWYDMKNDKFKSLLPDYCFKPYPTYLL